MNKLHLTAYGGKNCTGLKVYMNYNFARDPLKAVDYIIERVALHWIAPCFANEPQ